MDAYFNNHAHTCYSNIRLLDSINRPKKLIDKAIELGMSGIAITDHECLGSHIEVNQYAKEIKETHPDFTIALGNEIYLTDDRSSGQKYYHFILIAKDEIGHKALRELSSIAWYNLYVDRKMERVPITKSELRGIVNKYPGHLIATTACLGGELSTNVLLLNECESIGDNKNAMIYYNNICNFLNYCISLFGDDFYIECAPSTNIDQIRVNKRLYKIAKYFNVKMTLGTDAHYLTEKDRWIHKAYLNSKGGEREVDSFYEFARLMDLDETYELLKKSFDEDYIIDDIVNASNEIKNKIQFYSLERKQIVPKVPVYDYEKIYSVSDFPIIDYLLSSDNIQERYWINECLNELRNKNLYKTEYLERIETEADVIKFIGDKLEDCLFAYFNTFKHYIDLFWECGSIVGPGRGSATGFLSNYLLGITQLDPIRWSLPYWRFLNKERAELPDIDVDLAPSKRPEVFRRIREERGEFGLIQVATFGTEGTKSAILTACRGYRSDEYPDGIDVDVAQYLSSLVPQERGFLWSIDEVVNGNEEKDRKPVSLFVNEMKNYPGLLEIISSIEGLINKRGIHASGVILYGADPFETAAFMRAPNGDLITCYDLHDLEAAGNTKYDFLVTEISDKIIKAFNMMEEDNIIPTATLRQTYDSYLHPEVMDTENQALWDHLAEGDVLDVFQFSGGVGLAIAKKLKPQNPLEMTAANAMMRLMSEKGKESQQDRYARIKAQGIEVFDKEMRLHNLPEEMIELMHKHCDKYYGCCAIQEQMMEILMEVAHFTLGEANAARKVVAKKQMSKIPQLRQQVYDKIGDANIADYIWEVAVAPQLGYAFSLNHSLPYSFVGLQTIYLATKFNPIYWNTACLIVNSGATDEEAGASTDYGKIAKAIGDIRSAGINVSLANINESKYGFAPDVKNNRILFGLKGLLNVGDDVVAEIIEHRPYISIRDFLNKYDPGRQAMISLIKGGAFDEMMDRRVCMAWYLWETWDKKQRITLQNLSGLFKYNLVPQDEPKYVLAKRVYEFNRYLKAVCKGVNNSYKLDERAVNFLTEIGCDEMIHGQFELDMKQWEKVYKSYMDVFRLWIAENKEDILNDLNSEIFKETWLKYAKGTISAWEMEALCFYYHEHELINVCQEKYGFDDFFKLPEEPVVEKTFAKGDKEIKMFKISKICGTCIAKNKIKSTATILTTTGVVEVKFRKEYFTLFDKQISVKNADGTKKIVEKSWFNRGNMIVVQGIRSGDNFIAKTYSTTPGHTLYRVEALVDDELRLTHTRYQGGIEEEDND